MQRNLFVDEARARYSADDDGDRQAYFDRAWEIFSRNYERMSAEADAPADSE